MKTPNGLILAVLLFVMLVLGCSGGRRAANRSPNFDKSPATQAKRKQAIDELIERGVFDRIESNSTATSAWVNPTFYSLKFDQKRDVMNIVYGYYYNDDVSAVLIKDAMSGRIVGTYSLTLGLEMK